jgi:hypothetical protein
VAVFILRIKATKRMVVSALTAWSECPSPALADPRRAQAGCRAIPARDVGGRRKENAPVVGQPRDALAITESSGQSRAPSHGPAGIDLLEGPGSQPVFL